MNSPYRRTRESSDDRVAEPKIMYLRFLGVQKCSILQQKVLLCVSIGGTTSYFEGT